MTTEPTSEQITRIAQALIGEYGPMDIDADLDRWFFEKAVSPSDIVRFVLSAYFGPTDKEA